MMKIFTLSLTEQEVVLLGAALGELPYKASFALISKIQKQLETQQKEPHAESNG